MTKNSPRFTIIKPFGVLFATAVALLCASFAPQPTHASGVTAKDKSFSEARRIGEKYRILINQICNYDSACEQAKYEEYKSSGNEEGIIAGLFNNSIFTITQFDPYYVEYFYYFNDLATSLSNRDPERMSRDYPTTIFDVNITSPPHSWNFGLSFSGIAAQLVGTYYVGGSILPYGLSNASNITVKLAIPGDSDPILPETTFKTDFSDCINDGLEPGMVCRTYFNADEGIVHRATPKDLEEKPTVYPHLSPYPSSYLPGYTKPTGGPQDSTNHENQDQTQTQDQAENPQQAEDQQQSGNVTLVSTTLAADPHTSSIASENQTPRTDPANTNSLPLAPNTGQNGVYDRHLSRSNLLLYFVVLLGLSNATTLLVYFVRKSKKSPKKSRKTVDFFRKVR